MQPATAQLFILMSCLQPAPACQALCRWSVTPKRCLHTSVRDLQWGVQHLAATASNGSLRLFDLRLGHTLQLCILPPVLAVARSPSLWPGLSSFAFAPNSDRWLAVVHVPSGADADADLALVLRDVHRAGAIVWSYTLAKTWGAAVNPGEHHVCWSADGTALCVSVTAGGFLRKWHLSLGQNEPGCCGQGCRGSLHGTCPSYSHLSPEEFAGPDADDVASMMDMLHSLFAAG